MRMSYGGYYRGKKKKDYLRKTSSKKREGNRQEYLKKKIGLQKKGGGGPDCQTYLGRRRKRARNSTRRPKAWDDQQSPAGKGMGQGKVKRGKQSVGRKALMLKETNLFQ